MTKVLVAMTAVAAALALPQAKAQGALRFFRSPSGNIGCLIDPHGVRCDIVKKSWTAPPKPSSCPVDWGNGVQIGRRGSATFVCAGDTAIDPRSPVLRYGKTIRAGRFTCTSRVKDMRCSNRNTGHGFVLSRTRVRLR